MNKRIDDLKGQTLDQVVPYTWHHLNHVQMNDILNKFAELIIAECCVALHPMLRDMISRSKGVDLIVEHFRDK